MKKLIALLLLTCFCVSLFALTDPDYFRINQGGKRFNMQRTKTPVAGWMTFTAKEPAPISTNVDAGELIMYFDNTVSATPVLRFYAENVSGDIYFSYGVTLDAQ